MKQLLLALSLALVLSGCGYKPSSYYSKKGMGDRVYAKVEMLRSDPENTVVIKDAINEAVITKLKSKLVSESEANTKLFIKVASVSFSALQYDANGYVVLYRANVILQTSVVTAGGTRHFRTFGSYDFPVEPNTTISDSKRFDAIKNGGIKAIDMLISQISVLGALDETGPNSGKGD